jgi:glyoxylate carboligase
MPVPRSKLFVQVARMEGRGHIGTAYGWSSTAAQAHVAPAHPLRRRADQAAAREEMNKAFGQDLLRHTIGLSQIAAQFLHVYQRATG